MTEALSVTARAKAGTRKFTPLQHWYKYRLVKDP